MIKELILSIAITWVFARIIKTIISWYKEGFSLRAFHYDGGMPSSHTTSMVALSTSLFLETGLSALFVLSVIITLIIINDALNVRWTTQRQSIILNKLMKDDKDYKKLNEHVGHKPMEVIVALILGIIIPIIVYAII